MNKYLFFFAFVIVALVSCKSSEPTTTQNNTPEQTMEQAMKYPANAQAETIEVDTAETIDWSLQKTASGLEYQLLMPGNGPKPVAGDVVVVHYTGTLEDGTKFDSSVDRGQPFSFTLGKGQVIKGWDEGIALLKQGTRARLIIPPHLGYGDRSIGSIPPNSYLIFEVELLEIKK